VMRPFITGSDYVNQIGLEKVGPWRGAILLIDMPGRIVSAATASFRSVEKGHW
jgi:hypothetical protein